MRIKEGTLSNWGLLTRVFPGGSDYPYGYATINGYSRFKDIVGLDLAGLTTRATLGMSVDEFGRQDRQVQGFGSRRVVGLGRLRSGARHHSGAVAVVVSGPRRLAFDASG